MASGEEREGMGRAAPGGSADAGTMHGAHEHPDDPWYQPESGVPRDEDVDRPGPALSEDD